MSNDDDQQTKLNCSSPATSSSINNASQAANGDSSDQLTSKPTGRSVCPRCQRPAARTCVCAALPAAPLHLDQCHCVVLQHPLERRQRKNRSLPLIELCLDSDSISVVDGRRLGGTPNTLDPTTLRRIDASQQIVWVVFPDADAMPLKQALTTLPPDASATLVFWDATWKYAKEMDRASFQPSWQRVQLNVDDIPNFTPRRFDIRSPPSEQCLSTAECLAFVVSQVESRPDIYDTLMSPLDLMVEKWHSFYTEKSVGVKQKNSTPSSRTKKRRPGNPR